MPRRQVRSEPACVADRIHGALVGITVGAAEAACTVGRAPSDIAGGAPGDGADEAVTRAWAGLLAGADPASDEPWAVAAVRHGLLVRCDPMPDFVAAAPHGASGRPDRLGLGGTAVVAAALSATLDGVRPAAVTSLAVMAADEAADRADDVAGPDLGARLSWATALACRAEGDPLDVVSLLVGTSEVVQECVPAALAVVAAGGGPDCDGVDLVRRAAALGGGSDVVAVGVGALLGAAHGVAVFDAVGQTGAGWPVSREIAEAYAARRTDPPRS